MSQGLLLRFRVPSIVGQAYRAFAKDTRIVFKKDGRAHLNVRSKIKYMIRENPLNETPELLAEQVHQLSVALMKNIVQARENPEYGSLTIDLRRENFVDGKINLPRVPNQTFFRSERYIRNIFSKVKHHPNAEIIADVEC